jgi:DNA-binding NarL/FixJ family response regulator
MAEVIRVLLVDDHAVVREGLRNFLALQDGLEIVGEAGDGAEAIEQAQRLEPDVILMDLVMPGLDGIGAMRQLRVRSPGSRVIVLTSFLEDERILPAIQAGAAGYLLKNVEPSELARAIHAAHAGLRCGHVHCHHHRRVARSGSRIGAHTCSAGMDARDRRARCRRAGACGTGAGVGHAGRRNCRRRGRRLAPSRAR